MSSKSDVRFTEYALMRMHQRDILPDEVLLALSSRSKHKRRRDGRLEVRGRIPARGTLFVIYRRAPTGVTVINAMWEARS